MKKLVILSAVAIMGLSATAALAKHHKGGHERGEKKIEKMFEKKDTNKDGVISRSEFLKHAEERFAKMDKDGNGEVSQDEAKAYAMEKRKEWKQKKEQKNKSE